MDSKGLKIFHSVATLGSVSRAAEQLHYVQSNITAHIKRLEDTLGTALFFRQSRGMALTPAGHVLLEYSTQVLQLFSEARKAVDEAANNGGSLHIGALETVMAGRLPPLLARYRRDHPEIRLEVTTGSSEFLANEVLKHRLDGALIAGTLEHPELMTDHAFDEQLVLVSEAGRSIINKPRTQLSNEVLLAFKSGCAYRRRAELWLDEQGITPLQKMEFSSLDAIMGCVTAGMGVALLPRFLVQRPQHKGQIRMHSIPARYRQLPTRFIHHKTALQTRSLSAFRALLDAA